MRHGLQRLLPFTSTARPLSFSTPIYCSLLMSSSAAAAAAELAACEGSQPTMTATTVSILPGSFGRVLHTTAANPQASVPTVTHIPVAASELDIRKKSLRQSLESSLKQLSPSQLSASSAQLLDPLLAHPLYKQSKALCLFVSMPSGEIQTDAILLQALKDGKTVFVPRIPPLGKKKDAAATAGVEASSAASTGAVAASASSSSVSISSPSLPPPRMQMLQLVSSEDLLLLPANRWGIREPTLLHLTSTAGVEKGQARKEAATCEELDLIVCPGVAFDANCNRLGHGKGFYDEYLLYLSRTLNRTIRTIAIGLDQQIVKEVPVGGMDVKIDEILTPTHHYKR